MSLPDDHVENLDVDAPKGWPAAVRTAITLLRSSELGAAYEEAWAEWDASEDAEMWDRASK